MELSLRWADRSRRAHGDNPAALFGIVQGGVHDGLRLESLEGCCGSASTVRRRRIVGRRAAADAAHPGPARDPACRRTGRTTSWLGTPEDIVEAVRRGIDMFDCVLPTRNARNGHLFTHTGPYGSATRSMRGHRPARSVVRLLHRRNYSRSYLRHLDRCNEILGARLNTIHNLHYYLSLMRGLRGPSRRHAGRVRRRVLRVAPAALAERPGSAPDRATSPRRLCHNPPRSCVRQSSSDPRVALALFHQTFPRVFRDELLHHRGARRSARAQRRRSRMQESPHGLLFPIGLLVVLYFFMIRRRSSGKRAQEMSSR